MQIHEYSTLERALTGTDAFVIDTGTVTWKVLFSSLASAVNALNPKVVYGAAANAITVAAGSAESRAYSFAQGTPSGVTFNTAPYVFAQLVGGDGATTSYRGQIQIFVDSVTTTEVTLRIYNASAASIALRLNWMAIGS